jgi:tetratricopeptide (TPR) repeat protein
MRMNQSVEAIRDFDHALEMEDDNVLVLVNRAVAKANLGENQEALENLGRAEEYNDHLAPIFVVRARIQRSLGDDDAAIVSLRRAVSVATTNQELHESNFELAISLRRRERYSETVEALREALKAHLPCPACWADLAEAAEAGFGKQHASKTVMSVSVPEHDLRSRLIRNTALRERGLSGEALDDLLPEGKVDTWHANVLGLECTREGRYDDAVRLFDSALEESRELPFAYNRFVALILSRSPLMESVDTERELREVNHNEETAELRYALAGIEAARGNESAAYELLEAAIELDDDVRNFLRGDPAWDRVRREPRFRAFLPRDR